MDERGFRWLNDLTNKHSVFVVFFCVTSNAVLLLNFHHVFDNFRPDSTLYVAGTFQMGGKTQIDLEESTLCLFL